MSHGWALANLIVQVVLFFWVCIGAYLAATRKYLRHCLFMRIAVGLQVVAIGVFMIVPLTRYVRHWSGWSRFMAEIIIHHSLGVIVLLLFIYINLAVAGWVKAPKRLRIVMRTTLGLWLIVLVLGGYLYYHIWR